MTIVYLLADIEGAIGIWRRRQCHIGRPDWWQIGRTALTADVNSVIDGARHGGASQIVVRDVHDRGYNLLVPQLRPGINYIGGVQFHPNAIIGRVPPADIAFLIAQHARSGSEGFFAHTMSGFFAEVRLDGKPIGEVTIFAAALGELGIPVGMVSGDTFAIEEAKEIIPWARMVEVSKGESTGNSASLAIEREKLRRTTEEVIKNQLNTQSLVLKDPMTLELEFQTIELAKKRNSWNYNRQGATLILETPSGLAMLDDIIRVAYYSRKTWPLRRIFGALRRRIDSRRFL